MSNQKLACAYTRFSTDHQNQSSTIGQLKAIRRFAEQNGYEIIDTYIDEGQTGTNTNRESFQRMLSDAPKALWKTVIVYNMSRLSRSVKDTLLIKDTFLEMGIKVVSVIEQQEDTPEGNFFNLITYGMNELFVKQFTRDTWRGLLVNAREGKALGGRPPFGYDKDRTTKKYIINDKEAEAVKYIFNGVLQGKSYREMVDFLNQNGYTDKGKPIHYNLTDILRNERYTGVYIWNEKTGKDKTGKRNNHQFKKPEEVVRIDGAMPQIIDKDTFNRVQKILDNRKATGIHVKISSKYFLSGIVKCGYCGSAYVGYNAYSGRNKNLREIYACNHTNKIVCKGKDINRNYLDEYIEKLMLKVILCEENLDYFLKKIKSIHQSKENSNKKILLELRRQKVQISNKIKELAESLAKAQDDNYVELSKEIGVLTTEKAKIETEEFKVEQKTKFLKIPLKRDLIAQIKRDRKLFRSSKEFRKEITLKYIPKIILTNEWISTNVNLNGFLGEFIEDKSMLLIGKEVRESVSWEQLHRLQNLSTEIFDTGIKEDKQKLAPKMVDYV